LLQREIDLYVARPVMRVRQIEFQQPMFVRRTVEEGTATNLLVALCAPSFTSAGRVRSLRYAPGRPFGIARPRAKR
jgi:hypothetical protein